MASSPLPPVLDGDVVAGKYRVDSVIGRGGMGVVVAATHLELGTRVALKFLTTEDNANNVALERFRREARAGGQLKSDHAVRVFDFGCLATGEPYLVMELLEGADLADVLAASSALPLEDIIDWMLQACEAIGEAHEAGIVHRDLKPTNLFLAQRPGAPDQLKVLDFGIAKSMQKRGDLALTRTTEVLGSPVYMAPEQLRASRDVDERTDIWALGVVLYELVTGRLPFLGDSVSQVTASIIEDTPPAVGDLRRDVPVDLARIIAKCMAKDPAARFGSIAELRAALAPLLTLPMAIPRARISTRNMPDRAPSGAAPTSLSWADTEPARVPVRAVRSRLPVFVGLSALALAGAGAAVVRFGALGRAVPTATASSTPIASDASPALPLAPPAIEAPPSTATATASASSSPSPSPSPSAKRSVVVPRPRPSAHDVADAPPASAFGPADFPAVRK